MNISLYHKHSYLNKGKLTTIVVAILLLFVTYTATAAYHYEPDKTPENVQKKAVIIKHDARLFNDATGFRGSSAQFMHIYFLMKPTRHTRFSFRKKYDQGNRVAVSVRPYKTDRPDGWLDKKSFVKWNTLQMIKLEPQSGRKLAKIFKNRYCAKLFGKKGKVKRGCKVLGTEPNRFTSKTNFQLLIPVFQKRRKTYQGGFIRVYEKDSAVKAAHASLKMPTPSRLHRHRLGYDIVFVVDKLKSHFTPAMEVLETIIKLMQQSVSKGKDMPLRIGVLFYRHRGDRNRNSSCVRGYLTKWGQHLTADVNRVIDALASEKPDTCYDEHKNDAVLDALNRVVSGTQWKDNHFKSIILVGDAPPYPVYDRKNPMRLSVYQINKRALKKNIRIITFKLGNDDKAFRKLALDTAATNRGQYYNIPISTGNIQMFKHNLLKAITNEWQMLEIAQSMVDNSRSENTQAKHRNLTDIVRLDNQALLSKYKMTQYQALIIQARLPDTTEATVVAPEFVKGWIPQEIQNQSAVGEFIFMDKFNLKTLTNALGRIAKAALIGSEDGSMAFIRSIRHVLAAQTRVPANRLFRSGESLAGTLKKAKILPFRTDILTFTAQEVNTWKPTDYRRINTVLNEKVNILVEFMGNPKNSHYFGNTRHFYVPRAFFP